MARRKSDGKSAMNASLWGNLQHHVALENVYAKLPYREFFQLRLVCQEWNRLASDRAFLEEKFKDPIQAPFFFLKTTFEKKRVNGILACSVTTGRWSWTRLHPLNGRDGAFDLEGLIYSEGIRVRLFGLERPRFDPLRLYRPRDITVKQRVFNVHTRVWHKLPRPVQRSGNIPIVGMVVDTSVSPYTFKVIQGSSELGTQIYDSKTNSWEIRPSRLGDTRRGEMYMSEDPQRLIFRRQSSGYCNGLLYIKSEAEKIAVYNVEKDIWSSLVPGDDNCRSIGAWQGRLFGIHSSYECRSVEIWKLLDQSKQKWKKHSRMPRNLYSWLYYLKGAADYDYDYDMGPLVEMYTSFSNKYVLVYAWLCYHAKVERVVLLNLDTKIWKAHQPFGESEESELLKIPEESEVSEDSEEDESDWSEEDDEAQDSEESDESGESDGSEGSEGCTVM